MCPPVGNMCPDVDYVPHSRYVTGNFSHQDQTPNDGANVTKSHLAQNGPHFATFTRAENPKRESFDAVTIEIKNIVMNLTSKTCGTRNTT